MHPGRLTRKAPGLLKGHIFGQEFKGNVGTLVSLTD